MLTSLFRRRLLAAATFFTLTSAPWLAVSADDAVSETSGPVAADSIEVQVQSLNGVYEQLPVPLTPIQQGPMTVLLRSPNNALTVHEHRVRITPTDEPGVIEALFESNIEGWGDLVIDLDMGVSQSRFDDRVVAGRQWLRMSGTVRLEILPGQYSVTFLDYLHDSVGIQIQSNVGTQMVESCRALQAFGFVAIDCDALNSSFSRVSVPLPDVGSTYFLPRELFSEVDLEKIDRLAVPGGS